MYETEAELDALDDLLTASLTGATGHLRSIVTGEHTLDARQTARVLTGMRLLSLATVTASGEPRISAADGHFLHARWVFSTDGGAAKAGHLRARPQASVAHLDGEDLGVFAHGRVEFLDPSHPDFAAIEAHLTAHYGSSPSSWGDDIVYLRLVPHWMVVYAGAKAKVLAAAAADGPPGQDAGTSDRGAGTSAQDAGTSAGSA